MTILPLHPANNASPEALQAFLTHCQAAAVKDNHAKLVSISLAVSALDPLAVLESIFEPGEPHFYAERPGLESALAGAEVAVSHEAHGPGRFAAVQGFIDDTLAHTIAVGDVEAPFGGPHFFTAFAFNDEAEPGDAFPAARVFVPRWQVARAGATTTAVANLLVTADADLATLAERVWRAHGKFSKFSYRESPPVAVAAGPNFSTREAGDYRGAVARALDYIAAGEFEKIELARAIDLQLTQPLHPLRVLNGLRQRFPECYAFSLANGRGQSFIGATPEQLVRVSKGALETAALAGTTGRGVGASEDATLGAALLRSEKDLREHRVVVETIAGRLAQRGLKLEYAPQPGLRRLANVQHLHTPDPRRAARRRPAAGRGGVAASHAGGRGSAGGGGDCAHPRTRGFSTRPLRRGAGLAQRARRRRVFRRHPLGAGRGRDGACVCGRGDRRGFDAREGVCRNRAEV